MERAAVYTRISRLTDDDTSTSLERQEADCLAFAQEKGWQVGPGDIFRDANRSAFSNKRSRPAFVRLTKLAEEGRYQHLVIWKLDRLSRDWAQWGELLRNLQGRVVVWAVADNKNSQDDYFVISILAAVAQQESANTSTRIHSYRKHRWSQGKWPGGRRPYGYRQVKAPDGEGWILVPDAHQAAVLRQAADLAIGGMGINAITRRLNEQGHRTNPTARYPEGAPWGPTVLRRALLNRALLGQAKSAASPLGVRLDANGEPLQLWEPIFSHEVMERLHEALRPPPQAPRRFSAALLSGITRCGRCGSRMYGRTDTMSNSSYTCKNYVDKGRSICVGTSANVRRLNSAIVPLTLFRLNRLNIAAGFDEPSHDPDPLRERRAQLLLQQRELDEAWKLGAFKGPGGSERFARMNEPLNAALEQVELAIEAQPPREPTVSERLRALANFLGDPFFTSPRQQAATEWDKLDLYVQRQLVAIVFEKIVVHPHDGVKRGRPKGAWYPERIELFFHDGSSRRLSQEDEAPEYEEEPDDDRHFDDADLPEWLRALNDY